ncbi:MAG: V-type ATP synthase subunit E family protein [Sphaerochaetaceae bacterium]
MNNDNKLLGGIKDQADVKAEAILKDAKEKAKSIISDAYIQADKEVKIEERQFKNKLAVEELKKNATMKAAKRKVELELLDEQYSKLIEMVKDETLNLLTGPQSNEILINWIIEAVLGLGLDKAKIAFSPKTPVNEEMLKQVIKKAKDVYSLDLELSLDSRRLVVPGIVATSLDGKISFNNQVDIRMRRFDRDIKIAVQEGSCPQE